MERKADQSSHQHPVPYAIIYALYYSLHRCVILPVWYCMQTSLEKSIHKRWQLSTPGATGQPLGAFVDVDGLHDAQREHSIVVIAVRHHRVHGYASWHIEGWDVHTVWLIIGFAQCPASTGLSMGAISAIQDALHAGQDASIMHCTSLTDASVQCRKVSGGL